jgi:antitoxin VapB
MKMTTLFQNGQSQAVRLPKEFRMPGAKVYIKRVDNAIVLLPIENPWESLCQSIHKFSPDFMNDRNQPKNQERDFFK